MVTIVCTLSTGVTADVVIDRGGVCWGDDMGAAVLGDNGATASDDDGATFGAADDESCDGAIGMGDDERESGSGNCDGEGERDGAARWSIGSL